VALRQRSDVKLLLPSSARSLFEQACKEEELNNLQMAFALHTKAALSGEMMSQLAVGNMYSWGQGTNKNRRKAAKFYRMAYRSGYSDGALNLAIDYQASRNLRSAKVWFERAMAMKNGDAFLAMAKIYSKKRKSKKRAIDILERALRLNRDHLSDAARVEGSEILERLRMG
jgi:TPR repeat protein